MNKTCPELITTERLVLKKPSLAFIEIAIEAVNESLPELQPWMIWAQQAATIENYQANMAKAIEEFETGKDFRYYIFDKNSDYHIGCASFHRINWEIPKLEIGYWLRTSCWNRGYAQEIVHYLTNLALTELSANRIEIRCAEHNLRSKAVAEKCGYSLEGLFRNEALTPGGQLRNTLIFSRIPENCMK